MNLFDFTEIPAEGDRWMLFARDFFQNLGFYVEQPIRREGTNLFDFCAVEQVAGRFNSHPFRWLVSCHHKAATRTAVKENDEIDVLERFLHGKADGFIGFYSTPVSVPLADTLSELKGNGSIKDYRFFDAKSLETYLATPGFHRIACRYFPKYAQTSRAISPLGKDYLPIRCDHCGKDLLEALFLEDQQGVVVRLRRRKTTPDEMDVVGDVYVACKGTCDEQLQSVYCGGTSLSTAGWIALSDLVMPPVFMERILALLDQLGKDEVIYSAQALEKEEALFRALAQRTLREPTEGEIQRAKKIS